MRDISELDKVDRVILTAVQEDARLNLETLADTCGVSAASVQRRLKKLRDRGVIKQEVAVLDPHAVGQSMCFIVMVEMERERLDQLDAFTRSAREEPQVQQCYYITGDADFCLICTAKDMQGFEDLTKRLFFDNGNVRRFRTSVVMGKRKVGLAVPVD